MGAADDYLEIQDLVTLTSVMSDFLGSVLGVDADLSAQALEHTERQE